MSKRKAAIINVSKSLLDVSLATVIAIAGASGNAPVAGVATLVQATLGSGILKSVLERKQVERLELPVPRWWTNEPQYESWQAVCSSIEDYLPAILKGVEERLRQETSYPSSAVVKRLFIEQVARQLSPWEVRQQDRYMVAADVTPLLLEKTANVLKAAIDTTRQDVLAQWLAETARKLDEIQQATVVMPSPVQASSTALTASPMPQATIPVQDAKTVALKLESKLQAGNYDVYICYDDEDETEVMKVGEQLKTRGVLPWFDGLDVRPGNPMKLQQEEQIMKVRAACVFIGQHAIARGQLLQIYAFIQQYIDRKCAIIPVLLPDAPKKPELPPFLAEFGWVDYRKQVPDPLKQLVWGITGLRP